MSSVFKALKRQGRGLVAIAIMLSLFWFTRLPALSATERHKLASRFHFSRLALPELASITAAKSIRAVHPSLARQPG